MNKARRAKKLAEQANLINRDRPDPNEPRSNVPTGVPVEATIASTELPAPTPAVFKKGETTSAPQPLAKTEPVRGETDFTAATTAGAALTVLTGNAKLLVSALLMVGLFCCLVFCLWMIKIDSEKGLLVWSSGYIDSSIKVAYVASVFTAFTILGLIGYAADRLFRLIVRLFRNWTSRIISWWRTRSG